ncbi:MAG: FHA domain-containing protein [Planctomycetota bacterium]
MASLFVVSGKARGNYYLLNEGTVIVGRDEKADIQIVDEMVSRSHLEVTYEDGKPGQRRRHDQDRGDDAALHGQDHQRPRHRDGLHQEARRARQEHPDQVVAINRAGPGGRTAPRRWQWRRH